MGRGFLIYHRFSFILCATLLQNSVVSAFFFHGTTVFRSVFQKDNTRILQYARPLSSTTTTTPPALRAEFGELSISEELPPLDPAWIGAARKPLSWEALSVTNTDVYDVVPSDNIDDDPSSSLWQNGQRWFVTREALMDLWVLPRDMSNGSWENYADAAIRGEEKVLQQVPQLLRLESESIILSAKTVLNELGLPPALLRKEPILLSMSPDRLRGGFESIRNMNSDDINDKSALEACRDTEGLLVKAATKWTRSSDHGLLDNKNKDDDLGIKATDNIHLLQKSFDNEVSADDLHMKPFLSDNEDEKKMN